MRFYTFKFSLYLRAAFAVCLFLINSLAIAKDKEYKRGEVYITINNSNDNLLQLFTIIEKQTSFSFAYDENDVNLSTTNYYKKIPTPILINITGHSKESLFLTYINKREDKDANADLFMQFYEELNKDKQPQLKVIKNGTND